MTRHSSRALRGTLEHWLLAGSNPIKICCNLAGGVGATKNDELIVEASVGMWSVETICADLPGAIDTIS